VAGLAVLVLFIGGVSLVYLVSEQLGDNITRFQNTFGGLDEATRPPPTGALTFLLVGTDSRSESTPAGVSANGARSESDVVMVAQVAPDRKSATVISIPRDSLVDVPGRGADRIAAAYAVGGPTLLIQTVEGLTALRIDHFAVIDFNGFRSMVDSVGGIDVDVPAPVGGFARGPTHMNGAQALGYVRDGTGFVNGDRARRQQAALRAILVKAVSTDTLTDPVRLYDFLDAASEAMGVDDTLSNGGMRALALRLGDLRPDDVLFVRAPVSAVVRDGPRTFMRLDGERATGLWAAVKAGTTGDYVQQNGRDALGSVTS
jgi:LCP family protein required for cell wall assembly